MRRKSWPKATAREGALGRMSKIFQVYFIHINFFKKSNKKIYIKAKELYCDATILVFWFFIVYLPKKMEAEKWPKAADSSLPKDIFIKICVWFLKSYNTLSFVTFTLHLIRQWTSIGCHS